MGNKPPKGAFSDTKWRVEAKSGKIQVSARYHNAPHKIEDDYKIRRKVLGRGLSGAVREAVSRTNSTRKYAVKAFNLKNLTKGEKKRLESEIEIFLTLDHGNITRLFDVYESEENLALVMECMEGGELFDRLRERRQFSEVDSADAIWQILLAVNYLHSLGIVHRDLKMENFLYNTKTGNLLKLIDFGLSKVTDPNRKLEGTCGTLSYVAPEVLTGTYTSQCDMWSIGVISFMVLSGCMPFFGSGVIKTANICKGRYIMKPEKWDNISEQARNFVQSLLQVNPEKRLNAQQALQHPWIATRTPGPSEIDNSVVDALRQFGQASKFRRCCFEMMAWILAYEDRTKVRHAFDLLDEDKSGTITLVEFKKVMHDQFNIPHWEIQTMFDALDSNNDEEIAYSDFLAAMVSTRIALRDDLLEAAFRKFDTDSSGYIEVDNLREVIGDKFHGTKVETLITEADLLHDNRVSYPEFVSYLRGDSLQELGVDVELLQKSIKKGKQATSIACVSCFPCVLFPSVVLFAARWKQRA